MMLAATIEHSLNYFNTKEAFSMSKDLSVLYNHFAEAYNLEKSYDVSAISYWRFAAVLFLYIINKVSTIQWNFTDVFIVVVATGLAEKYKYLNKSVIKSLRKERNEIYWLQCREKYAKLSDLVKETDKTISPLIFLSYFINLYIICIQLYNGIFITADGTLAYVYFFASFLFIISRITAVTMSATRIHNQSKIILPKIYCCSPSLFTREAERLQYQLTVDEVALTGMNFFSITRRFIFTLPGTDRLSRLMNVGKYIPSDLSPECRQKRRHNDYGENKKKPEKKFCLNFQKIPVELIKSETIDKDDQTERKDNELIAELPKICTLLPRARTLPKQKVPTKWQQFAKEKGIKNKKKPKLNWDEELKKWIPTFGYKKVAAEYQKNWVVELKTGDTPQETKVSSAKSEKIAKNELQRLRNLAKAKKISIPRVGYLSIQ
ncbi:hypothetical protein HCN44_007584 [Aphidius gifuensis]|uniref:Ribosome biogenesis regulatory protein n=1 Tax=Aphidius gifuensis TaxID=684658 RepID=A0A834XMP2_APHGI|nr:hypothetical protein HCN44_007584 [Aphidius gifuensis]